MGNGWTMPAECNTPDKARTYIASAFTAMDGYAAQYLDVSNNVIADPAKKQLNDLYRTLNHEKAQLNAQIRELKSSIERHNRDFVDLEGHITPNIGSIHTVDDYTLWTLILSYLLFAIALIFLYCHLNNYTWKSIGMGVGGMTLISFFLFVLAIIVL
jgi:hypothetical protein